MKKHAESHMDHGFNSDQWAFIFTKYADKTEFFIDTFELPEGLGTVTNELYGPSAGDPPVLESEIVWEKRGDREWYSRLVLKPKRPTRFVRVIAGPYKEKCKRCDGKGILPSSPFSWYSHGPHEVECLECKQGMIEHACILYTAYGVASIDAPQSPKETGDLVRPLQTLLGEQSSFVHAMGVGVEAEQRLAEINVAVAAAQKVYLEASAFWAEHALAAPLSMMPCATCNAPKMGDAVYDPPVPDTDGRCQTCGTL